MSESPERGRATASGSGAPAHRESETSTAAEPAAQRVAVITRVQNWARGWRLGEGDASAPPRPPGTAPSLAARALGAFDLSLSLDHEAYVTQVSEASQDLLGRKREDLLGLRAVELVCPEQGEAFAALLARAAASGSAQGGVFRLPGAGGGQVHADLRVVAIEPDSARGSYWIGGIDVSHWAQAAARAEFDATHDALTGLGNAVSARRAITHHFARPGGTPQPLTVMAIDLDHFQRINHGLGYDAGDQLLQQTAARLCQAAAGGDIVTRAGSDKFVILSTLHERGEVGGYARRVLSTILQPYEYEQQRLHLSACIGIASSATAPAEPLGLLRTADRALHAAKRTGSNTFRFFTPQADPAAVDRLKLEAELFDAVRNGEFSLHYQPIADIANMSVVGVEALMRWHHPRRGLVPPADFIPLAESVGLIGFLGTWALKCACMQLTHWDAMGLRLPYVAVNVSAQQFTDRSFVDTLRETLKLSGVAAQRIVLEITESVLMQDAAATRTLLAQCTALGVRFAVDDFGTGYSSLAYLQQFPLAELKIDRGFVENLTTSKNDRGIVAAVAALAHSLNLKLVAKGVETEAQRLLLEKLGCAHMQGWLLSKPIPAEQLASGFQTGALALAAAA